MDTVRWVIVILLLVVLVGLLAFARGREHHRGDEEGALAGRVGVVRVEV
jgi:hypothetical protein